MFELVELLLVGLLVVGEERFCGWTTFLKNLEVFSLSERLGEPCSVGIRAWLKAALRSGSGIVLSRREC